MDTVTTSQAEARPGSRSAGLHPVEALSPSRRLAAFVLAALAGVLIAGFWNFSLVDGFGRDVVAGNLIGDVRGLSGDYGVRGGGFGFVFAIVAGLAATFTACNCVVFAMMPGLACATDARDSRRTAVRSVVVMVACVMLVGAVYGLFVGWLGPEGAAAFNSGPIRRAQASVVFSVLGSVMLLWALIELGLLAGVVSRFSPVTRAFFSQTSTRAALIGAMVGAFAIGRPFPVFREFLLYAAQSSQPLYGAAVMALQGLGQILVMILLFLLLIAVLGRRMEAWFVSRPHHVPLLSGLGLALGGAYFVFYWGIARIWPVLGRWGFQLGLYG